MSFDVTNVDADQYDTTVYFLRGRGGGRWARVGSI